MQLQEGVNLHFIPTDKFTTNYIKIRFAAPMSKETVAGRVLVANMIEMANQDYPSSQDFRKRLANLYGMTFSTSVSRQGKTHLVDITIQYIRDEYVKDDISLTKQVLYFIQSVLFHPLATNQMFEQQLFEIEKKNLLSYLEAEVEDKFYHADIELNRLFFEDEDLKVPRVGTLELVERETPASTFQAFQNMLKRDKIDIFIVGKVDESMVRDCMLAWEFSYRRPKLQFDYQQDFSNITREKIEKNVSRQSILELAYHLQLVYNSVNYFALLVFNNLLGSDSHSKLFLNVREKEGLAYTIGSSLNASSGFLRVYAGIDKQDRVKVMRLIRKQIRDMKTGRFTDEELELTKQMLVQSATIAQDKVVTLVEQEYRQMIYKDQQLDFENWVKGIDAIRREDVIKVAQRIKLQAVYFMEGVD